MQKFNEKNVSTWQNNSVWLRGFFMLVFGFIAGFARFAITLIAILQFLSLLLRQKPHSGLQVFGHTLNNYLYQINRFLTVNSEEYPFPLGTWPSSR